MAFKKFTPAQKAAYFERKRKEEAERLNNARKNFKRLENPSCFQTKVFEDIAYGTGHTVVDAVAGSGKTTTLLNGLFQIPPGKTACFCAFGHDPAEELKNRCPVGGVDINTTHSFGSRAVKKRFKFSRIDKYKLKNLAISLLGDPNANPEQLNEELSERIDQLCKAVSLSKQCLAHDEESLEELIDDFGLEFLTEDERKDHLSDEVLESKRMNFIHMCLRLQHMSKTSTSTYDFDDMIWLPVVLNLPMDQFDLVFVDETQDLNKCQMQLVLKMIKRNGRIIAVGDERQAIYLFRGADQDSMSNLVTALNAKRLPLSVTYRCAKKVVQYVKDNINGMDHLQAAENSDEGEVVEATYDDMLKNAKPGDFIISRVNATNVALATKLIVNNQACNIRGKDLGDYFKYFIKRSKAKNIVEFLDYLMNWEEEQIEALLKRKKKPVNLDAMVENIKDRAACMHMLAKGCDDLKAMTDKITNLFTDQEEENIIILGTTHKLKGLERNQVWMLLDTFKVGKDVEEDNLFYVACTRAKKKLNVVRGPMKEDKT